MSVGTFALSPNGGIALAQIAQHYLDNWGGLLLAFIVILACLKTAIGLITACAEMFHTLFPKGSYSFYVAGASLLPCLFANVGLTNIIQFSLPVLMFLYPLAITLMILTILGPLFKNRKEVYQGTTYVTFLAAFLDALNATPSFIKEQKFIAPILKTAQHYLPFFSVGLGWLVPALIGFVLGILLLALKKNTHFSKS